MDMASKEKQTRMMQAVKEKYGTVRNNLKISMLIWIGFHVLTCLISVYIYYVSTEMMLLQVLVFLLPSFVGILIASLFAVMICNGTRVLLWLMIIGGILPFLVNFTSMVQLLGAGFTLSLWFVGMTLVDNMIQFITGIFWLRSASYKAYAKEINGTVSKKGESQL
ncbi:MAG: hypothetical protein PHP50_12555 [Lachnospiraceae bacterium]|nr:hypothetical protein [Lachnospiraceae bacterium]